MANQKISIIIPSFNEHENIENTYFTVKEVLQKNDIPFEIIFVDDGSSDPTYIKVYELSQKYDDVHGICFSRNFGKESAIFAGLEAAEGACAVIMDCDLQHPPKVIPDMYRLWKEGYEVVEGVKSYRGKESFFHKMCAKSFYSMISKMTKTDMSRASDFKLLDRKAINALLQMPERAPFFRALSSWIGFRATSVPFEVGERKAGESKWSFFSLCKYAVRNLTSFSGSPLQIVTFLGWVMLLLSLGFGLEALYRYFSGTALAGFTTVILLQLIIGGILMLSLGIIGNYISRIYDEIKARPRYIITKKC